MAIVDAPNVGTPSTAMSNVKLALSPSASVAVHVYSVLDKATVGVPLTRWLLFLTTPLGSDGLSA